MPSVRHGAFRTENAPRPVPDQTDRLSSGTHTLDPIFAHFRSQLCINTAIVYMHRFYAFHSFTHFHRNGIAAASLFLAAKVTSRVAIAVASSSRRLTFVRASAF